MARCERVLRKKGAFVVVAAAAEAPKNCIMFQDCTARCGAGARDGPRQKMCRPARTDHL